MGIAVVDRGSRRERPKIADKERIVMEVDKGAGTKDLASKGY